MIGKLVLLAVVVGFIYLFFFNKPRHHSPEQLQAWVSTRLEEITRRLEPDIALDKQGQYPHQGRQDFGTRGEIVYTISDKQGARFDLSGKHRLTASDIESLQAWRSLQAKAQELGVTLEIDEVYERGDGIDDDESLDEYIDDTTRYFTVTAAGW